MIRLENDYSKLREAFDGHSHISVAPLGPAPFERYRITYNLPSLRLDAQGRPTVANATTIEIELSGSYPKDKPRAVSHEEVFHPNFGAWVCIADFWSPAQSLADIVIEIGQMLQWQKYNVQSPLSASAADWAVRHRDELPVGRINLVSNTSLPHIDLRGS
jgi:ubiquitin-protein ligase